MRVAGEAPPRQRFAHVPGEDSLAYINGKDLVFSLNNAVTLQVTAVFAPRVQCDPWRALVRCVCCIVAAAKQW